MSNTTIMIHGPFRARKSEYVGPPASHEWLWIESGNTRLTLHKVPNPRVIAAAINSDDPCQPLLVLLNHALELISSDKHELAQETIMNIREIAGATCDYLCDLATPDEQ